MLAYPAKLTKDTNGTYLIELPDIPEVTSVGEDIQDALVNMLDAPECTIQIYFDERRPVPLPSRPMPDQELVMLPVLQTSKVLLWNEMLSQKVRKAELARKLKVHTQQIDDLFDLGHSSKIQFIEKAFQVLGKNLEIRVS